MTAGAVEYLAETYGGDARSSVFLGGIITPTQRLALRWLRGQARRIADALDPYPYCLLYTSDAADESLPV